MTLSILELTIVPQSHILKLDRTNLVNKIYWSLNYSISSATLQAT